MIYDDIMTHGCTSRRRIMTSCTIFSLQTFCPGHLENPRKNERCNAMKFEGYLRRHQCRDVSVSLACHTRRLLPQSRGLILPCLAIPEHGGSVSQAVLLVRGVLRRDSWWTRGRTSVHRPAFVKGKLVASTLGIQRGRVGHVPRKAVAGILRPKMTVLRLSVAVLTAEKTGWAWNFRVGLLLATGLSVRREGLLILVLISTERLRLRIVLRVVGVLQLVFSLLGVLGRLEAGPALLLGLGLVRLRDKRRVSGEKEDQDQRPVPSCVCASLN